MLIERVKRSAFAGVTALTLSCLLLLPALALDENGKPIVGLALGGGGARGAAHIGVLRALEKEGLRPDLVVGNSMGSIVGSLYCAGVPLDEIEKLVLDGRLKKAYAPVPVFVQVLKKIATSPLNPFKEKSYPGFYSGESLAEFINDSVPENKRRVEDLSPRFAAVAVNLLDGQAYRLTQGDLGQAVRASASLPPILKPVVMDGNVYADGGIRANMPTYPTRAMGADLVIAVDVNEPIKKVGGKEIKSFLGIGNRMTSIVLAVVDELHLKVADVVIKPDVTGITILSSDPEDFKTAIAHGEKSTYAAVPEIRRKLAQLGVIVEKPAPENIDLAVVEDTKSPGPSERTAKDSSVESE